MRARCFFVLFFIFFTEKFIKNKKTTLSGIIWFVRVVCTKVLSHHSQTQVLPRASHVLTIHNVGSNARCILRQPVQKCWGFQFKRLIFFTDKAALILRKQNSRAIRWKLREVRLKNKNQLRTSIVSLKNVRGSSWKTSEARLRFCRRQKTPSVSERARRFAHANASQFVFRR